MEQPTLQQIPLANIRESKTNPRQDFNAEKLNELASSIKEHGVRVPILVRPLLPKGYELVAGARRLRASQIAGKTDIPSIITVMTDEEALEVQVIENLQREDLNPMEEARSYEALIKGKFKYTPASIAAKIGKDLGYIKKRLQLLKLGKEVQKAMSAGDIQLGHALHIAKIEDEELQKIALKMVTNDGATVAELEKEIAKEILVNLSSAPFKISDPDLLPRMGACTACPYNTSNSKDLFDSVKGAGSCTKPSCYTEKVSINFEKSTEAEVNKGNVVIPADQRSKVFEKYNNGTWLKEEYLDSERTCYEHPKNHTYKQIFSGRVKEIVTMDGENKIRRVYKKSDVMKLMPKEPWNQKRGRGGKIIDRTELIRQNRRDRIENDIFEKALSDTLAKKKSVDLLCEVAVTCAGYNIVEVARTLLEKGKTLASYENTKAIKMVMAKIQSFKTTDERLLWIIQEFSKKNSDLRDEFEKRFKLDSKKFAKEAKDIEAKQWTEKHPEVKKPAVKKAKPAKKK